MHTSAFPAGRHFGPSPAPLCGWPVSTPTASNNRAALKPRPTDGFSPDGAPRRERRTHDGGLIMQVERCPHSTCTRENIEALPWPDSGRLDSMAPAPNGCLLNCNSPPIAT
ncbi:hypothetical protein AAFF_G00106760 [Aldrovandia affinis]|uniref:Uncharacterized protein n=1 Tax=Aldrovandia affinis TaxID=143900 RepID=A0AAD7T291_9TELE|nr:hypothetical protein AAFF_G00106760 [Aldrovandia affinis]